MLLKFHKVFPYYFLFKQIRVGVEQPEYRRRSCKYGRRMNWLSLTGTSTTFSSDHFLFSQTPEKNNMDINFMAVLNIKILC